MTTTIKPLKAKLKVAEIRKAIRACIKGEAALLRHAEKLRKLATKEEASPKAAVRELGARRQLAAVDFERASIEQLKLAQALQQALDSGEWEKSDNVSVRSIFRCATVYR